ncbi:ankyrin repeat domain-containing protein 11 isoform X1 [Bradysia coprophila]|uniref:ankyrin repeat domain-containing protein 11 isoform X1 n=2 Tax=Bradysia coprophila TaxID=38358 RepID=UPI00187DA7DA|nr:ankyrin repeat domain-containing protein 11 isoform X1 [Bradysia coprophila]
MSFKQNVKAMPSHPRPRGFSSGSSSSGRSAAQNTPMSERQQMALLMQMTSSNQVELSPGGQSYLPARSRDRNERGETALHVAAIKGDHEGVKKLLDQGMSPNVADFAGWTPLHEACNHGHTNVAMMLVKAGANVNAKGLDDDTPLHDAAVMGQLKLVKLLVERGADPYLKNKKGKTPCDVASAPTVYNYLISAKDTAGGGRSSQQNKKPSDAKKVQDDADDSSSLAGITASTNSTPNTTASNVTKDEDDVYEFKSTPKDSSSSSGDDKSDAGKGSDKSSDEKSDDQTVNQLKRTYSDVETNEDGNSADDETKRKKRKDSEQTVKDAGKGSVSSRNTPQRQEKGAKASGGPAKSVCLNKVSTALERKSPCPSPKPPNNKTTDSDAEADDKNGDNFGSSGPKVPPLKIVIPQQGMSGDQETGSRNGKNASTRNHAALPYVVASSSNSNDSADKESVSSRCTSPSDSAKSVDEKKMSNEEQRQQRVLRSSHRGGQSVDRGSNNSSPQLQSSSPSPAPASTCDPSTNEATPKQASTSTPNNNPSPANAPSTSDTDNNTNVPSPSSTSSTKESTQNTVDLHPRKRKIRASKEENKQSVSAPSSSTSSTDNNDNVPSNEIHPHDQPITNCYQSFHLIRQQIERRHRNLFPVQPKAPQGFQDYLMNRRTYVLDGKTPNDVTTNTPATVAVQMKDLYTMQEKERHKLKMQHVVEKEKLVLAVEQEILRVHSRAARALANQSLPFSACTILRDEEVYNMITPEQEEKDRNARSRYNGRLFISWLQDVDDKWEKIKEAMVLRHHNEAESLNAVQKMDWEWKMKELTLCEYKAQPVIEETHVPMVHVSEDFDLLPA